MSVIVNDRLAEVANTPDAAYGGTPGQSAVPIANILQKSRSLNERHAQMTAMY